MSNEADKRPIDLEQTARRARRLMGRASIDGGRGRLEASGATAGPPGDHDRAAIAQVISRHLAGSEMTGASVSAQADAVAADLVQRARTALEQLEGGAPDGQLRGRDALALEAVIHTRGRPALRVVADGLEDLAPYPGASIWEIAVDQFRQAIVSGCESTAAIRVKDLFAPQAEWVQGTAWLIAGNRAITNRHVLFPPLGGLSLARRLPGTTQARMKSDVEVTLDFAFDDAGARDRRYRVKDVLFVAAAGDPVDAAVLEVERIAGPDLKPLAFATSDPFDLTRLYVIGHPGRMPEVPAEVRAVFGDPDERKRVSLGELMDPDKLDPDEIVHDASTIGGYSGGCVFGIAAPEVHALHYWGDVQAGNRAITAAAMRRHPVLGPLIV